MAINLLLQGQRCLRARPDLPAFDPRALDVALAVQYDEVRVCTRAERALLVLDAEAPRGVERRAADRLAERAAREAREVADALVEGDDAVRGVSEVCVGER